jgi:disulfide bond formation protein DsbB
MFNKVIGIIKTVYQNYFEIGATIGALLIVGMAIVMDRLLYLDACPLCIMTRYLFMFIAAVSFVGFVFKRIRILSRLLTVFFGVLGLIVNSRQIYLQNLSAEEISMLTPNCGMPLETQIEYFGFFAGISRAFEGGPTCAEDGWRFVFNFAEWALIFFIVLVGASVLKLVFKR